MTWRPEQQEILNHESFVSELLKFRTPGADREPSKPLWLRFLETTGGTALITVLIGGIIGGIITANIQDRNKDSDFQRGWLEARGNQSLVAYREYLQGEQETVKRTYELIGSSIAASDNVITLTENDFDLRRYQGEDQDALRAQRRAIRDSFTKADEDWRAHRQSLGFLMTYFHHNDASVASAWATTERAVNALMDCGRGWYLEHAREGKFVTQEEASAACNKEREAVATALRQLTSAMETTRHYAWEGWESPEKMKASLGSK